MTSRELPPPVTTRPKRLKPPADPMVKLLYLLRRRKGVLRLRSAEAIEQLMGERDQANTTLALTIDYLRRSLVATVGIAPTGGAKELTDAYVELIRTQRARIHLLEKQATTRP